MIRARVHAGAEGVRVVRTVRLAAVTTELQCMREYANNGMGRHKQVRWESGRWCIEEVYMGQGGGRDRSGGRSQGRGPQVTLQSGRNPMSFLVSQRFHAQSFRCNMCILVRRRRL